ncbi:MAG: hypothetical protein JSV63_03705 [Candidatus Aenigmatarchaeota archaeon]|nr:MAG: hypothetical protein JSV63_03705 [Candidatus Aenigmarchaeota archaeon]
MYASQWVLKKLKELLGDAGNNTKEIESIFKKYPDDFSLQSVSTMFTDYSNKPAKAKLDSMHSKIDEIINTRKFESSGGTRLWFGDRRKRGSQTTR